MDLGRPYTVICPTLEGPVLDVLAHTTRPLTGREIARLASRGSERGVRLVLHRLVAQGLVTAREAGSASLFALNREHVAAGIVEDLVRLRAELIERIRGEIEAWSSRPVHVSVFGSAARADGHVESDIDLLIVRPEDLAEDDPQWREQLHRLAERIERWSGNHASLHEVTTKGLKAALRRGEPVIASLRDDASIVLAGPELAALLTERRERAIA
jgi:predicted nucleotidyltransferase